MLLTKVISLLTVSRQRQQMCLGVLVAPLAVSDGTNCDIVVIGFITDFILDGVICFDGTT